MEEPKFEGKQTIWTNYQGNLRNKLVPRCNSLAEKWLADSPRTQFQFPSLRNAKKMMHNPM